MKDQIAQRFERNIKRVRHLVGSYSQIAGTGRGRRPVNTSDLLRAATVFLHATLEDFLRSIEMWKLPGASEERLSQVALAETKGRAEKFALGKLAAHRGKTVDALITESVTEHLERSNYNDTTDISAVLQLADVVVAEVNGQFSQLDVLMKRRHHIVHRADENETSGQGQFQTRSISTVAVNRWIEAVEQFASGVLARL